MPTMVTPARKIAYVLGAQFRSAVSEELIQRLAATNNFISLYQHSEKQFFLNGAYNLAPLPFLGADGLAFFQFNAQIIDVWMFIEQSGSSGTTELDIKTATTSGGAFTSIFATTPKIANTAGDYSWTHVGGSAGTGLTVPVFTASAAAISVTAGQALRCDLIQAQGGTPNGCGLLVHYQPV